MNAHAGRDTPLPRFNKIWRRLISAVWFVAITGTLALAGAKPLLGFPVALGLIFLSIVFPGNNSCATGDANKRLADLASG
jgi:hypothetical protein